MFYYLFKYIDINGIVEKMIIKITYNLENGFQNDLKVIIYK